MASSSSSSSSMRGDAHIMDSQRFCAISFLKSLPDDTEKRFAIKVSGCFPTEDDAKIHIAKLMALANATWLHTAMLWQCPQNRAPPEETASPMQALGASGSGPPSGADAQVRLCGRC